MMAQVTTTVSIDLCDVMTGQATGFDSRHWSGLAVSIRHRQMHALLFHTCITPSGTKPKISPIDKHGITMS